MKIVFAACSRTWMISTSKSRSAKNSCSSWETYRYFHSVFILQIYREAEKCLTCLSYRLGNNNFFYGNSPSSLDAVVYGCLAPLVKAPFPSNVLQNHVKASANLLRFVSRITQRYFPRELNGNILSLKNYITIFFKWDVS